MAAAAALSVDLVRMRRWPDLPKTVQRAPAMESAGRDFLVSKLSSLVPAADFHDTPASLAVKVPTAWPYRPICFHTAGFRPDDESIFVIYILCRCCVTCLKKMLLHV